MTQEDKELLLKDLCARLPYDVICEVKFKESGKYKSLSMSLFGIFKDEAYFTSQRGTVYSNDYKPYLFPLSSMTEEQRNESESLMEVVNIPVWGDILTPSTEYYDWLNKHHFDYRGLIEKGLALNAIGLNIY